MGIFWLVTSITLFLQLTALILYSAHLYQRFDVSTDFAHNVQAWYLIGHGNLNPVDTVRLTATPFLRDHFDLIIWVLSLLRWLWPQPVILLYFQDLAIIATEAITLMWVSAILVEHLPTRRNIAAIIALVALVANPWWYWTVSFDIHMPPLAAPFFVLTGYSFWKGRFRRALITSAICLLFGAVVAEIVIVVGIAALLSRHVLHRGGARWALGVILLGITWFGVINILGVNQASNLVSSYGYLADSTTHIGLFSIIRGATHHPSRIIEVLHERWQALLYELWPTGVVGLLTSWGFFFFLGVLVVTALTITPAYSSLEAAFQNLPAMPFLFIGSVMVIVKLGSFARPERTNVDQNTSRVIPRRTNAPKTIARLAPMLAIALALTATTVVLVQSAILVRQIPHEWLRVTNEQAAELQRALTVIPSNAEVIASYGIVGRFSERKFIYELVAPHQQFDVNTSPIYFVITPTAGNESLDKRDANADVRFVQSSLHAITLIGVDGVWVLEWRPTSNTRLVVMSG